MSPGAKVVNTVYWLALTAWVAVLVAAAVAAATTFTVLPGLVVNVDGFAALPAVEHGRIAAGKVMEPIFTFVDVVQVVVVPLVLLCVVIQRLVVRVPLRRPANAVRVIALIGAAALFGGRAALLAPDMNRELRAYWTAAAAGDTEGARAHRATFDMLHPRASDLFTATLALLVVAVAASPAALAPRSRTGGGARPRTPALARLT